MEVRQHGRDPPVYAVLDESRTDDAADGICAWVWAWKSATEWCWYCRRHRSLVCADIRAVVDYRAAHGEPRYYTAAKDG